MTQVTAKIPVRFDNRSVPIKSYLAYPEPGSAAQALAGTLNSVPGCEAWSALNREVLILVTDTPDDAEERFLEERLAAIPELACLAMVSGAEPDLVLVEETRC